MAHPKNAQELFNHHVPEALKANPAKAKEIGAIYQFKIGGEGGGVWTVNLKAEEVFCREGGAEQHGTADCTIEVAHEDFMTMLTNPTAGMQLYFTGKLKVQGDPMLATKLQKLFTMAG